MQFLENILAFTLKQDLVYSHQSLAEEWLFFEFLIRKELFVAEENLGLHKRELLKYHESFPILVFDVSLSIAIELQWSVKDTIMWLILVFIASLISVKTLFILDLCNRIIMICKGYHNVINLGIYSKSYISIDPVFPGSLPKDLS